MWKGIGGSAPLYYPVCDLLSLPFDMYSSVFISLFCIAAAYSAAPTTYRICVPEPAYQACLKMVEQGKGVGVRMTCVAARDRLDCINKIKEHQADFEPADPEDMYVAGKLSDADFSVFKEIRTKEEPQAPYRYDAVLVVPNDVTINKIQDLKGLRSCHTGVGRNVGYKIPITKLTNMGILGPLSDSSLSPRENELKALSQFFSKSCIVGQWSPDQKTNQRLKSTYSNLCALCEHPDKCDYPDANSGYEGALRCLAKAGGDVAFTKVIFVKKFFGMAYGSQPAKTNEYDASKYSYLCPDASKKPITGPPCTWASRPWQGYMADSKMTAEFKELRAEISKLNNLGETQHAEWISKVLMLNNVTVAVDNEPQSPLKYLESAKYLDVIEKDVLKPRRVVRMCVVGAVEYAKCQDLEKAAYSRDIRPSLSCVKKTTVKECLKAVNEKQAEAVIVDPHVAIRAESEYNLVPVVNEQYNKENKQDLVAVVRKGSVVKTFQDLKGKKACLVANDHSGFVGVMKHLLNQKYIQKNSCPYEMAMKEFFSGVEQSDDPTECLIFGKGDVAFVPYSSLHEVKDDIEVLCASKDKKPLEGAVGCGVVTLPPRMVMTSKNLTPVQIDEVKHTVLSAGQYFATHPEVFRLFGDYDSKANVIFSNHANGMAAIDAPLPAYEEYKKLVKNLAQCNA